MLLAAGKFSEQFAARLGAALFVANFLEIGARIHQHLRELHTEDSLNLPEGGRQVQRHEAVAGHHPQTQCILVLEFAAILAQRLYGFAVVRYPFWQAWRVKHAQQGTGVVHVVERLVHYVGVETFGHVLLVERKYLGLLLRIDGLGVLVVGAMNADIGLRRPENIGEKALPSAHEHDGARRYAGPGGHGL